MKSIFDRAKQKIEREKLQEQAVSLSSSFPHICLEWATGCGKTLAALKIIEQSDDDWWVFVPESNTIENFKADMWQHGYEWMLGNKIKAIECYASMKKYKGTEGCFLFDEAHRISEARAATIE
jgi:superfamily II DNA or RNA helicase